MKSTFSVRSIIYPLLLVAALAGEKTWPEVYEHAVARRMRFYSYGDCMLILPGLAGLKGS